MLLGGIRTIKAYFQSGQNAGVATYYRGGLFREVVQWPGRVHGHNREVVSLRGGLFREVVQWPGRVHGHNREVVSLGRWFSGL